MSSDAVHVFAWDDAREWAEEALERHGTLAAWAESAPEALRLTGRGTVFVVHAPAPGPEARPRWAVRHYLRGGAVAALLRDRYLDVGASRPERELEASSAARARGLPTPAVVAGATYPAGPMRYTADLVTELVPDSMDLARVLFEAPPAGRGRSDAAPTTPSRSDALRATGALLVRTAMAGVRHADLNARNVVIRDGDDGVEAYLVDLDRGRIRNTPRPADARAMRDRLTHSLRKLGRGYGKPLGDEDWQALTDGVTEARSGRSG
ncbi:MAG: lipopolysaccharide kinase InaA family protein [Gemmatimonadota bacterium]